MKKCVLFSVSICLLFASGAFAGIKYERPHSKVDDRAAIKNLGKIKSAQVVMKKLETTAARKPIEKVTK